MEWQQACYRNNCTKVLHSISEGCKLFLLKCTNGIKTQSNARAKRKILSIIYFCKITLFKKKRHVEDWEESDGTVLIHYCVFLFKHTL